MDELGWPGIVVELNRDRLILQVWMMSCGGAAKG
jgi:hypothetical protein